MGRPAFTFINLYIFCNLQRIINKNIHFDSELESEDKMENYVNNLLGVRDDV
jgi:hypothetical protein